MKLVFFGTPSFSASILSYLLQQHFNVVAVVTQLPKPKGRSKALIPTPVAEVAKAHSLPLFEPRRPSEVVSALSSLDADLFVVAAYGALLKEDLLNMPRLGAINVHTSLLPKYRGAAPIQRALIAGEEETGVTIMRMVLELDAGDILEQKALPIPPTMTYGELEEALCKEAKPLLLQVIGDLERGKATSTPQDPSKATYAAKIEPSECEINWSLSAAETHNLIRGLSPKPGAFCKVQINGVSKRLKVLRSVLSDPEGKGLRVSCRDRDLFLLEVQLEGKRKMSAQELLAGYLHHQLQF